MDEHAIIDGLSGGDPILAGLESRLPDSPTDPRLLKDAASKLDRLRWWMHTQSLDGVLISRRDNFAWLTVGGDSHVLKTTENRRSKAASLLTRPCPAAA